MKELLRCVSAMNGGTHIAQVMYIRIHCSGPCASSSAWVDEEMVVILYCLEAFIEVYKTRPNGEEMDTHVCV